MCLASYCLARKVAGALVARFYATTWTICPSFDYLRRHGRAVSKRFICIFPQHAWLGSGIMVVLETRWHIMQSQKFIDETFSDWRHAKTLLRTFVHVWPCQEHFSPVTEQASRVQWTGYRMPNSSEIDQQIHSLHKVLNSSDSRISINKCVENQIIKKLERNQSTREHSIWTLAVESHVDPLCRKSITISISLRRHLRFSLWSSSSIISLNLSCSSCDLRFASSTSQNSLVRARAHWYFSRLGFRAFVASLKFNFSSQLPFCHSFSYGPNSRLYFHCH